MDFAILLSENDYIYHDTEYDYYYVSEEEYLESIIYNFR